MLKITVTANSKQQIYSSSCLATGTYSEVDKKFARKVLRLTHLTQCALSLCVLYFVIVNYCYIFNQY